MKGLIQFTGFIFHAVFLFSYSTLNQVRIEYDAKIFNIGLADGIDHLFDKNRKEWDKPV